MGEIFNEIDFTVVKIMIIVCYIRHLERQRSTAKRKNKMTRHLFFLHQDLRTE